MKKKSILSVFVSVLFLLSLVVTATEKPAGEEVKKMPENVKAAIDKSCFGCHNTDSRNDDAKEKLDFKKLDKLTTIKKISAYKEIGETIEKGEMPPKRFLKNYPDKNLTDDEKKLLMEWSKKEAEALVKGM